MAGLDTALLNVPAVCRILGRSESAVRRLIREELLPIIRIGGSVRIDPKKLSEWIAAGGGGYGRHKGQLSIKELAKNGKKVPVARQGVS